MGQFLGLVQLGTTLASSHLTKSSTGVPKFADAPPTFRIYGPSGIMGNGTGSLLKKDPSANGGTITGATNATPIVITSAGHLLTNNTRVTIAGVGGNTAANGDWQVTVIDANTFSLNGSVGNGVYTSGGVWNTTGLYAITYTVLGANGFLAGTNYVMLITWTMAGVVQADVHTFSVD